MSPSFIYMCIYMCVYMSKHKHTMEYKSYKRLK